MYQRISELVGFLEDVTAKPVLLVGDFMLDEYIYGDAERISPEAPVPVLRVVDRQSQLGGAGSVAASLLALGCKTYCAGVIGGDAGRRVHSLLEKAGADLSCMVDDDEMETPLKQRLVGLAQHRIPQQLLRVDHENHRPCSQKALVKLKKRVENALHKVAIVAVEDYNKGLLEGDFGEWLIRRAKELSLPVIVDPAPLKDYSRYRGADVITPNRMEASLASGMGIVSPADAAAAGKMLHDKFDIGAVAVTLDAEGIYVVNDDLSEHITTERRDVFDITGAGDVVLATLVLGLAGGLDLPGAGILANVAGGWEVQQSGAVPITHEQLQWELLQRHRSHRGKVVDQASLLKELEMFRQRGKRVVFTNGCFDLLHPGHISIFEFARGQGDLLVVGVNSDKSTKELKGPTRPLINETDRSRMIAALEAVDYVVIFDDASVQPLIEAIKPEILIKGAKGRDAKPDGVVGYDYVVGYGGKVVLAPIETEYSTTSVIQAIRDLPDDDIAEAPNK